MKREDRGPDVLEHWTPAEVAAAFGRDEIVLIDVRTPQEFGVERIDGALLAPMQALAPAHLPDQSVKRIVLHCGSGVRSRKVAERCLDAGAGRIAHMEGGLKGWKDAGFAYTGTDVNTGAPTRMKIEV